MPVPPPHPLRSQGINRFAIALYATVVLGFSIFLVYYHQPRSALLTLTTNYIQTAAYILIPAGGAAASAFSVALFDSVSFLPGSCLAPLSFEKNALLRLFLPLIFVSGVVMVFFFEFVYLQIRFLMDRNYTPPWAKAGTAVQLSTLGRSGSEGGDAGDGESEGEGGGSGEDTVRPLGEEGV
jgi:hypothetical protein